MADFGDELLFINNDSIVIDTGLSTREAAQAKLMQFLMEPGYIAAVSAHGAVSFEPYTFTESFEDIAKGRKNSSVFIRGPAYDGIPLMELLETSNSADSGTDTSSDASRLEKARLAVEKICKITEASFEQEIKLPNNGPLGTIVGTDGTILFLPPSIFNRALDSRGDITYSFYEGCWKNTALTEKDCLRFTAAAYAYAVYSGMPPFTQKDSQLRAADFYDKNFKKLSWICNVEAGDAESGDNSDAGSKKLFAETFANIEQNLSCSAPEMETKKKRRGKSSKKIVTIPSVAITELPPFTKRVITDSAAVPAYEAQQKRLKRVRFMRKNGTWIKVGIVAFVLLCIFVASRIRDYMNRPTTLGLEPAEVVEMFYDGFDQLNITVFDATRTDGAGDGISNMIATFFVTAKMRESYEGKYTYTPSQWFNIKNPHTVDIYGISQLTIEEDTRKATDNVRHFKAHYYLISTENYMVIVSEVNDELVLSFDEDRWLVSFFVSQEKDLDLGTDNFYDDLQTLIQPNSNYKPADVLNALSDKYEWLPTLKETEKGYEQLFANTVQWW
ncbi:MAG: hypothetical protein J5647_00820 [Spirochaetaceae bacterium]|nr:hypothetical protein [Spirochaetaceae bacterium]